MRRAATMVIIIFNYNSHWLLVGKCIEFKCLMHSTLESNVFQCSRSLCDAVQRGSFTAVGPAFFNSLPCNLLTWASSFYASILQAAEASRSWSFTPLVVPLFKMVRQHTSAVPLFGQWRDMCQTITLYSGQMFRWLNYLEKSCYKCDLPWAISANSSSQTRAPRRIDKGLTYRVFTCQQFSGPTLFFLFWVSWHGSSFNFFQVSTR